ncbi:metal ABC transporter solute-binding protein, Zn/Mn family [Planctomicrobium piriforme]|uniref:Manganese/zinc/iron transport system substrate-binding protein n=1 Tax=Planctomicrobium piriforme TaxID=1576369 RepID=A0A1I3RLG8_9PLAN|nr:zinc ABC transporter substrate-binding protein [Planctomicrobium piriforme]SFJ47078.1 manganese/zinc/iron transport system substrate-binding protein [Planctomicrobium piriforme]
MTRLPILLILILGLSACGKPPAAAKHDGPLNVVVTTSMVGDLVRHVAGDRAQVTALMGEGVDPHLYRPTSTDVGHMMKADILFYSGLGLEGAMQTAFESASKRGNTVIAVTDQLPKDVLHFPSQFSGHPDPHVWNDPGLWRKCLARVSEVLSEKDPEHAAEYRERAAAFDKELEALDQYAREAIATIPAENRYLVTAHDAFGYFSHAYGLTEKSVQGITTESEPGVQDINNLVDFLVQHKIPALFIEATVNAGSLRAVMERTKERGWTVAQGGLLYSDSMGTPGAYEGTYIGMIDHNVTTIVKALRGKAPEGGMQGQLQPAEK